MYQGVKSETSIDFFAGLRVSCFLIKTMYEPHYWRKSFLSQWKMYVNKINNQGLMDFSVGFK